MILPLPLLLQMSWITVLPSHSCRGTLQNLDLKLLHSSMQTSADHRSRWHHVSHMTDEKGETWSPSGMSKVTSRPESLVTDCSMHALQPPERHGRQGYPDESTALIVSWCQHSGDIDEQRSLMSAASCQTGTTVLCHAHNGMPEHTTGTGFVPGCITSDAPVAVGLCVLTSGASRQAERRHSARTAVGPAALLACST